jgi:hypothetical protein
MLVNTALLSTCERFSFAPLTSYIKKFFHFFALWPGVVSRLN